MYSHQRWFLAHVKTIADYLDFGDLILVCVRVGVIFCCPCGFLIDKIAFGFTLFLEAPVGIMSLLLEIITYSGNRQILRRGGMLVVSAFVALAWGGWFI